MRPDGKTEGLRQAMSWLHTWSGLVLGWLLFAIFLLGTFSYVRDEISVWMQPELHRSQAQASTPATAVAAMARLAPRAETWTISLPTERDPAVQVSWRDPGAAA
ncbi:PepSY-associated TM helix domain-containing protein, partial [Bordetella petrii]|uniref:PepSY-associated TM helix domain-containing protein n=1 Tax=Bordetella petrii TaxID=94624 RepID=UPI001E38C999